MENRGDGGLVITSADRLSGMTSKCVRNEVDEIDVLKQPFVLNSIFALKTSAPFSAHTRVLISP